MPSPETRIFLPPIPEFIDTDSRLRHLTRHSATEQSSIAANQPGNAKKELLQTVWYESRRAGLDAALELAMIEGLSSEWQYYVAPNGAFCYMAVKSAWAAKIGDGDVSKLMRPQVNLRLGCTLMRHYLCENQGDLNIALRRYIATNLDLAPEHPKVESLGARILAARQQLLSP